MLNSSIYVSLRENRDNIQANSSVHSFYVVLWLKKHQVCLYLQVSVLYYSLLIRNISALKGTLFYAEILEKNVSHSEWFDALEKLADSELFINH